MQEEDDKINLQLKKTLGSISEFKEPSYFNEISDRNTYLTPQERANLNTIFRRDPDDLELAEKLQDIMLKTKAIGKTVEEYFRNYGST